MKGFRFYAEMPQERKSKSASKAAYKARKQWSPTITEEQESLNDFCHNRMSLADALDYVTCNAWRFQ